MNKKHLIVIGGGPAGLLAAGTAAQKGCSVLLLEKMEQPGQKLRITGKGRCNLTNQTDLRTFISHFGKNGSFLYQAFSRFFVQDLLEFMNGLGVDTIVERGGRIFPASENAHEVADVLIDWAKKQGVEIRTHAAVQGILVQDGAVKGVALKNGQEISADAVILAVGGASYPATGSSGDGYLMAEKVGHTIIPIRPALVPLTTKGKLAVRMQGLSLKNVRATILVNGKKGTSEFGEMLFTHFGLSGPIILTLSGQVVDELRIGNKVEISIDLKPALDEQKLDNRLLRELDAHGKQYFGNMLKTLLPQKMISVCAEQVEIDEEKLCNQITAAERSTLLHWLKDFRFLIRGSLPLETAIITAGGVDLAEVDARTMQSKLVKGLFFAGEVLDLNADTGGYNLQEAFSTGWLAGDAASE
ncbi:MAG: NAD(P)/FAD-dependent oxidoreductase [Chloroflexi bacterium]|nr:NAD(P)/FAD-dependent oxidoreductase [Chloroflexota bacterium]